MVRRVRLKSIGRRLGVELGLGVWQRREREADQKLPALATGFQVSLQFLNFMKVVSCHRHEAWLQSCSAEIQLSDDQI